MRVRAMSVSPLVVRQGATAVTGFQPTDLSGLVAWYDASQITGLSDGEAVAQWDDLSGNNHHLTQGVAGQRPVFKTSILNGLPVVRADGTDDFLTNTTMPAMSARTVLCVLAKRSAISATIHGAWCLPGTPILADLYTRDGDSTTEYAWISNQDNNNQNTGVIVGLNTFKVVVCAVASASSFRPYEGLTLRTTFDPRDTVTASTGFRIAHALSLNGFGDFDYAEIAIYNVDLLDASRTMLTNYASSKWGL